MTTPRSAATSPSSGFPHDLFTLDFLNFPAGPGSTSGSMGGMGLDSPDNGGVAGMMGLGESSLGQMPEQSHSGAGGNTHSQAQGLAFSASPYGFSPDNSANAMNSIAGPSSQTLSTGGHSRRDSVGGAGPSMPSIAESNGTGAPSRGGSSRGGARKGETSTSRSAKRKSSGSTARGGNNAGNAAPSSDTAGGGGMDLDSDLNQNQAQTQALWAQVLAQQQQQQSSGAGMNGNSNANGNGQEIMEYPPSGGFGVPIGMLQQLESFHMQSPLVFDRKNAQAYSSMMPFMSEDAKNSLALGQMPAGFNNGLMTPGPSGDMFPQFRMDGPQMSPMTLEMLARSEGLDPNSSEFNMLPLLSPALHGHSQSLPSNLTSPAAGYAFSHAPSIASDSGFQQAMNFVNNQNSNQNQNQAAGQGGSQGQGQASGSGASSVSNLAGRSPLEALQEQQRLFQEQLTALQDQQRQLEATAAVVAAQAMQQQQMQGQGGGQGQAQSPARNGFGNNNANNGMGMGMHFAPGSQQTSPYISASGASSTSAPSRPATTPGHMGSAEPSPSYFSPLTSPALDASARFQSFGGPQTHSHPLSGERRGQSHFAQTFPLSALSSPALNPIGSSGGANQTLSPALNPVTDGLDDPEYVKQLLGGMDGISGAIGNGNGIGNVNGQGMMHPSPATGAPSQIFSPVQLAAYGSSSVSTSGTASNGSLGGHSHSSHTSSPLVTALGGGGAGPHRQSLPPKSRPSPLIKPTHHRHRHAGTGSIPSSPLIPMYKNGNAAMTAMGSAGSGSGGNSNIGVVPGTYLPQSAIEQVAQAASTSSTPSPVDLRDLRDIMPPPPVPVKQLSGAGDVNGKSQGTGSGQGNVQPMTPAALMNMGSNPAGMGVPMGRGMGSGSSMGSMSMGGGSIISPALEAQSMASQQTNGGGSSGRGANASTAGANGTAKQATGPAKGRRAAAAIAPAAPALDGSSPGAAGSAGRKGKGVKKGGRGGGVVGVRAAIKGAALAAAIPVPEGEIRKSSHKAAEQKRRDSLKAGFDELRLLLPPINTEALDPESGEPIPGSSAPRLLPKSSLVPDDNPNRGVSKVALLKFGNEHIVKLHAKVDKRDAYIEKLREEVARLRSGGGGDEVKMTVTLGPSASSSEDDDAEEGDDGLEGLEEEVDLLEYDVAAGEEEEEEEEDEEGDDEEEGGNEGAEGNGAEEMGEDEDMEDTTTADKVTAGHKKGRHSLGAPPTPGSAPKRLTRVASASKIRGRKSD